MKECPDNTYFHFYNANPKNRRSADCVVRAIATALEIDYVTCAKEMFDMYIKTGYIINDAKLEKKYIESKGWVAVKMPKKPDGKRYLVKEFINKFAKKNTSYIIHAGRLHTSCIVNKKVFDIWDCSNEYIGTYYEKK